MSISSKLADTFSNFLTLFGTDADCRITETEDCVSFSIIRGYSHLRTLRVVAEKEDFGKKWTVTLEIPRVVFTDPKEAVSMANDMIFISQVFANAQADIKGYVG